MDAILKTYLDKVNIVSNVSLKLPKLKKVESNKPSLPKLKLPKLNKANG